MEPSLTSSSSKICVHGEETSKALKWLSLFILTFVWISVCIYVCGDEGGRGREEGRERVANIYSSLWLWEEGLLLSLLLTLLSWLSSQFAIRMSPPILLWDYKHSEPHLVFFFLLQVLGLNSGHHSCVSWLFKLRVSELSFKYQQAQGVPTTV